MKTLIVLLLCSCCAIDNMVDRIEIPHDQLWWLYKDLRVVHVENRPYHQRITAVNSGSPFPKYSFQWNHYWNDSIKVGDIIPLTDSLRRELHFKNNWKRLY
jgi:hypothetical protein